MTDYQPANLSARPSAPDRMFSTRVTQFVDADQDVQIDAKLQFNIQPELIRFIAYMFFWTMCILAIILNQTVVKPLLLEGPTDGKSCPPFDTGEGFDVSKNSHLIRAFGFNNICSNWDYSPSREITAAYYPTFEFSLLLYICVEYLNISIHHKKGLVSTRFYVAYKICFPFLIVFAAWFRLIFVGIAYINVSLHTFGFLTLQLVLIAVACFNVCFIVEAKIEYDIFRGHTQAFSYLYLFCNSIISAIKIYLTLYVVATHGYPSWANSPLNSGTTTVPGQIIDWIWMIFNAILPVIFSFVRSRSENPLEVTIDFKPLARDDAEDELAKDNISNPLLTGEIL